MDDKKKYRLDLPAVPKSEDKEFLKMEEYERRHPQEESEDYGDDE